MKRWSEVITLPISILLLVGFNWVGQRAGWHLYGIEVIQKLVIGLVMLLFIIAIARVLVWIQFPASYRKWEDDFNPRKKWEVLSDRERVLVGLGLFVLFCLVYALIVNGL